MKKYSESYKFIIVGILNTVVGYGAFFILLKVVGFNYIMALTLSHVVGVANSYIWNNKWTFQYGKINWSSLVKFLLVYLLTFLVNLGLLFVLVRYFAMEPLIAQAIAMVVTTAISYIGHKYWSFSRKQI